MSQDIKLPLVSTQVVYIPKKYRVIVMYTATCVLL